MNGRVFISYRRRLLARVQPVVAALKRAGIGYFLDVEDIDPLEPFPERIRNAIDGSYALMAVWSEDYAQSDHCLAELKRAWQHARRYGPDVGRRVWIVNPEGSANHITAGELAEQNFLALPQPGQENAWVAALKGRLAALVPEGPLADERKGRPAPDRRNVPTPTATFIGRNAEMFRIHSRLHPVRIGGLGAAVAVQTHGLGGVGKSELAAKYSDDFADAYEEIVWLNLAGYQPGDAAKEEEAEAAWRRAVEQCWRGEPDLFLDAEGKAAAPALVRRRLAERFAGRGAYLWILDNVPVLQPEDVRDRILAFWRAPTANGRTLITTRDSRPAAGIAAERLDVLGEEDALRLLHRHRPISGDERVAAEEIVAEVGGHTQALVLLGERLREGAGGYPQALVRLRAEGRLKRIEAIAEQLRGELGDKARGIVATFADSIGAQDASARALLRLAAECASNELIPLALLEAASGVQPNDDGFDGALRRLLRASLLTRRREAEAPGAPVEVHPLVADVARRLVGPGDDGPAGQPLMEGMAGAARDAVLRGLAKLFPLHPERIHATWPSCRALLPHIQAIISQLDAHAASEDLGLLLNGMGLFFRAVGSCPRRWCRWIEQSRPAARFQLAL
jgi:hypothetical protein